jgi:hypothetical protein
MATTAMNVDFLAIQAAAKTLLTTGFTATTWVLNTYYNVNALVKPTGASTHYYRCSIPGTSGGTEPTWPTTFRATKVDGTALTWIEEEPITVSYLRPSSCTYPRVLVRDIEIDTESQLSMVNSPITVLRLPLDLICWINGTTKTWEQMRQQCFDVLKQVQSIMRLNPTLGGYAGAQAMQATSGVYRIAEASNVIYHIQIDWMLKFIVTKT